MDKNMHIEVRRRPLADHFEARGVCLLDSGAAIKYTLVRLASHVRASLVASTAYVNIVIDYQMDYATIVDYRVKNAMKTSSIGKGLPVTGVDYRSVDRKVDLSGSRAGVGSG